MTYYFSCAGWLAFLTRGRKRRSTFLVSIFVFLYLIMRMADDNSTHHTAKCPAQKSNVVYIKMIKCASETLVSILRRYGYLRNLSFVLPVGKRIYLGWPYEMSQTFYRPSKTRSFNMLVDHAVYNETIMAQIMPKDTVYITSIREPFNQFKSMFNYYKLALNSKMDSTLMDSISEYLQHLDKYESVYKSHGATKTRYCIPDGHSMSKNLMAFNLGFPTGNPEGSRGLSHDEKSIKSFFDSI